MKPKFKVGDKVRVLRASTDEEHDLWVDSWVPFSMDKYIGEVHTIIDILTYSTDFVPNPEYATYRLSNSYIFPEFVLQNEIQIGQQLLFSFMEE